MPGEWLGLAALPANGSNLGKDRSWPKLTANASRRSTARSHPVTGLPRSLQYSPGVTHIFMLFLLCLATLTDGFAEEQTLFAHAPQVVELHQDDFDDEVLFDSKPWVVLFYAHWCGHCQSFAPKYAEAANQFDDPRVSWGALNCGVYGDFCKRMEVIGYPTVKVFHFPGVSKEGVPGIAKKGTDNTGYALQYSWFRDATTEVLKQVRSLVPSGWSPPPRKSPRLAVAKSNVVAPNVTQASAGIRMAWSREQPAPVQHLWDAEVALLYSLYQGVFLQGKVNNSSADQFPTLSGAALSELCRWTKFLSKALPTMASRSNTEVLWDIACYSEEKSGHLTKESWLEVVDRVKGLDHVPHEAANDPEKHFLVCKTYTCGLWQLFHILTVSSVMSSQGLLFMSKEDDRISPQETLARIHGFVSFFLGCEFCVQHFSETFDSCSFGRCALAPGDGAGTSLWLWQVHNAVSIRVAGERAVEVPQRWPPREECPLCWKPDGGFDPKAVFEHLKTTYWLQSWPESSSPTYLSGWNKVLAIFMVFLLMAAVVSIGCGAQSCINPDPARSKSN